MNVPANNLRHAIADDCHDNDCELHHIDVAIAEEVVDDTNVAFHIAGARAVIDIVHAQSKLGALPITGQSLERAFETLLANIETAGGQ